MQTLTCKNCSKEFVREQRQITSSKLKGSKNTFCGSACAASYNNKHTTREPRVSRFEKWIQGRIFEEFPRP